MKLRGGDGSVVWAVKIGAMQPAAIAIDDAGRITMAGFATTAPGVTTAAAYRAPSAGAVNPLSIVRLSADGDVVFAATFGGHAVNGVSTCVSGAWFSCLSDPFTGAAAVLLDGQGHIWIAGSTNEIDLPVTRNAIKGACGCSLSAGDGYLVEFSADGSSLLYATYLGTSTKDEKDVGGADAILAAAMDGTGRIWLAGRTNGTDLPVTSDAAQQTLQGEQDGFVLQYDPAANRLVYGTYYGAQATNTVTRIAIGPGGSPVFAGHLGADYQNPYSFGNNVVAMLKPSGIDATEFPRYGAGGGLALTPSGSLAVAGSGGVITLMDESTDKLPSVLGVTNSASKDASGRVSPGEILSLVGANLGPASPLRAQTSAGQHGVGTELGGVRVLFDGVAAPLLYVSNSQIDVVAPFDLASRTETSVEVETDGGTSNLARLGVVEAMPAVYLSGARNRYLPVAAALNEDGTVNSENNRAVPGSVISIFVTGLGALAPQPVDGSILSGVLPRLQQNVQVIDTDFEEVLYAGPAPGQVAGAMQVSFRLSKNFVYMPVVGLFAGGESTQFFTVWVSGF